MMVRVGCKHWDAEYLFEVEGDVATSVAMIEGTQERVAPKIPYDTETLKANACKWEVVDT
jgi:hypothetical protein